MLRGLLIAASLVGATGYVTGVFQPGYSRVVSRPPAEVKAALEKLDFAALPGAPGSTADAAGGIKPLFRLAEQDNRVTWYVMSGDKVATAMTAALEPVDGGKTTRITTNVQRGDAPDDFVSPAFRSKSLTLALFDAAIESKMNVLTMPAPVSAETCRELFDRFAAENMAAQPNARQASFADGLRQVIRLNAEEPELRRHGCNTNADGTFRSAEQRMADGDSNALAAAGIGEPRPAGSPSSIDSPTGDFSPSHQHRPGEPMLDPRPTR